MTNITTVFQRSLIGLMLNLDKDRNHFDNSDYPKESSFHFDEIKKVIGTMKDEAAETPITEFAELRSRMYSFTLEQKTVKM